jgi:hypothetical protein
LLTDRELARGWCGASDLNRLLRPDAATHPAASPRFWVPMWALPIATSAVTVIASRVSLRVHPYPASHALPAQT